MLGEVLAGLRAAGESTRLRLLFVLSQGEFNVTELTEILSQSQPRVSRHLKLMADAGLLERYREGSWALFRLSRDGVGGNLARTVAGLLDAADPVLARDLDRTRQVFAGRAAAAQAYFAANAADWNTIRALHVEEGEVEARIRALVGEAPVGTFVDLGTGTGRLLELLAPLAERAVGVDLNPDMLAVARAALDAAGLRHAQVRQADLFALPFDDASADLVSLHQVLHFLDEPGRAVAEAARILKPGGRLLAVDFAPHDLEFLRDDFAHRRLGIAHYEIADWFEAAGLDPVSHQRLAAPAHLAMQGLAVAFWLGRRRAAQGLRLTIAGGTR